MDDAPRRKGRRRSHPVIASSRFQREVMDTDLPRRLRGGSPSLSPTQQDSILAPIVHTTKHPYPHQPPHTPISITSPSTTPNPPTPTAPLPSPAGAKVNREEIPTSSPITARNCRSLYACCGNAIVVMLTKWDQDIINIRRPRIAT